jgi:transforming growth factor-beta-induced protein
MGTASRLYVITILAAALVAGPIWAADATIPAIVWQQSDLSVTARAIQATGYTKTLQASCPYTIFAPIDCAWERLCKPTAQDLLDPGNKSVLTAILLHHIVKGTYTLCDLQNAKCCPMVLKTLDGGTITVRVEDSGVDVDGARVLGEGISASNGTVFKIDRVLIPPGVRAK